MKHTPFLLLLAASCAAPPDHSWHRGARLATVVASSFDGVREGATFVADYDSFEVAATGSLVDRSGSKALTGEILAGLSSFNDRDALEMGAGGRVFLNPGGLVPLFVSGHVISTRFQGEGHQEAMRLGMGLEVPLSDEGVYFDFVADYTIPVRSSRSLDVEGVGIRFGIGWNK